MKRSQNATYSRNTHESVLLVFRGFAVLFEFCFNLFWVGFDGTVQGIAKTLDGLDAD